MEKKYIEDKRFLLPLYLYIAVDFLTSIWLLIVVSDIVVIDHPLFENKLNGSFLRWFAFIFVWGYSTGIGGLAGHELIHKKEVVHKFFGTCQFSKFLYGHFLIEHISGHHKKLATIDDPATPLKGDDLYTFSLRSAVHGFYNTLIRETHRVNHLHKKLNGNDITLIWAHIFKNKILLIVAIQGLMLYSIYEIFGLKALAVQILVSIIGIFMVEWINYIEHYGLQRNKDSNGVFESITLQHSWNSYSTTLLFRIQRHSDHHAHAYRPY